MKKLVGFVLSFGMIMIFATGCSAAKDELNGSYETSNGDSKLELEVDGDDALMILYGESMEGTVDRSKKTMTFKDKKETAEFTYKIVGSKLSLKSDDVGSFAFEKVSKDEDGTGTAKKKKTTSSSKEKNNSVDSASTEDSDDKQYQYEDYFSLGTGEYEVGSDIKPGAYNVNFNFYDFSDAAKEDGSGYIEVTHGDSVKKYDFENSDVERRIILKDGDLVNSVPENSDSDFDFWSDDE